MAESATVTGEVATARRLVELLEQDGFKLDFAAWAKDKEEEGRLYLVPHGGNESKLRQSIRVATIISKHKDQLPGRHDLRYSVVTFENPVIRAIRSASPVAGKVGGVYRQGTYVDAAYVFRTAA
jgi:hypothetical protein